MVLPSVQELTLVLLFLIFIHLKLKLQIPASNDEKYVYLWKMVLQNVIICLTEYLSQTILWISVAFY